MTLKHDDIQTGDRVYSVHHNCLFSVVYKDPDNLLIKRIDGHPHNPQHLLSPIGGLHYGLQSYGEYKAIAKLTDQLNAMPKSRWL
jgi:hypothetical protein